jgi:hypothetical protein
MGIQEEQHGLTGPRGSLDGDGRGDHDEPYRFGSPLNSAGWPAAVAHEQATDPLPDLLIHDIRLRLVPEAACRPNF